MVKISLSKKTFDGMLLLLIYLQLVILEFFGLGQTLNKIVSALIIARFLFGGIRRGERKRIMCVCGIFLMYMLSSLFSSTLNFSNILSNGLMQLYPMIYVFYITYICKYEQELIDNFIKKGFWIFNITMIANIVVMIIQINSPYSINAVNTSAEISFYQDLISGLFAYASTHIVSLFTSFIVIYNLSYMHKIQKAAMKFLLSIYLCLIVILSFYISLNNDNKAFFLIFPLSILFYIFMIESTNKRVKRGLMCVSLIPIAFFILYSTNTYVQNFFDENIMSTVNIIQSAIKIGNQANGSNERIAILGYAFKLPSTWIFGEGFGNTSIYQSGYHGFNHFGQADMGSLLILGGVWYTLLLFYYYSNSFLGIIAGKNYRRAASVIKVMVIAFLVITTVYQQCLTRTNAVTALSLIMLVFRYKLNSSETVKIKGEVKNTYLRGVVEV